MRYIDTMDSAYDVDKVVEELKEKINDDSCDGIGTIWGTDAIEIAKQGGASSEDLCEYRRPLEGYNSLFITSCCHLYRVGHDFKFCPNCGKKIKVVEQMDEEDYCYCHYHDDTYEYFDCLDYMECDECPYYYGDEDQVVD